MRILFINIYQTLVSRGAETFVRELSQRLSGEVDIISGSKLPPNRSSFLWRFFVDPNGLAIAWFTLRNITKIVKGKYDIIIPLNGGWQSVIVRIVSFVTGSKMVISGQSGNGWDDRVNICSLPDCFIALTEYSKSWARGLNKLTRVEKIANGVDLKKFTPNGDVFRSGLKKPVVLAVGAFTLQKNLEAVIEAVSLLNNVNLLLVGGNGDQKDFLQSLGVNKLGNRFKILTVPYNDMPKVYRSADVFTLVSESSEAFGNVYVEALATGLPVIATDDPQRREVVGDAGIFVDPKDITKYSKALERALTSKSRQKSITQAENFSWDNIAKRYDDLFTKLISK